MMERKCIKKEALLRQPKYENEYQHFHSTLLHCENGLSASSEIKYSNKLYNLKHYDRSLKNTNVDAQLRRSENTTSNPNSSQTLFGEVFLVRLEVKLGMSKK